MGIDNKMWLQYWKKSLSDSLRADIEIDKLAHFEIGEFNIYSSSAVDLEKVNELIDAQECRLNVKRGIRDKKSDRWETIHQILILISPFGVRPIPEDFVFLKDKKTKFPFWYNAFLDREGCLSVPDEIFPVFQRKYLEPIADEQTEFVFSRVEDVDRAIIVGKEELTTYEEYIDYIREVFYSAVGCELEEYNVSGYEVTKNGLILLPDEEINAAIGIIELYEKILNEEEEPGLLQDFIHMDNDIARSPLTVSGLMGINALHLGQMKSDFPLSISQRKGLYTFLNNEGKVFAVNGPPGTGKTTLLQSVVANKVVESAIKGEEAPIILACSTNNQAVTNIIESFSKSNANAEELSGRWLPGFNGYATYLPASTTPDSKLRGINYKKLNGDGLFQKLENETYLEMAKNSFLQRGGEYFGDPGLSVSEIVNKLQHKIIEIQSSLTDAALVWKKYLEAERVFTDSYINQETKTADYYVGGVLSEAVLKNDINQLKEIEKQILFYFKSESVFRKLGCCLGIRAALENRRAEIRMILRDSLVALTSGIELKKISFLDQIDKKINMAQMLIRTILAWTNWKEQHAIAGNPPRTEKEYWELEYYKIQKDNRPNCFYDGLDVRMRHRAFQLAVHYWEGRWLLELDKNLSESDFDKKGVESVKKRWQRQAMLTPCFVSTFFMAPKFFSSFKFLKQSEDGKNIFDNPPLFEFIDLLIVDEAGQVSPEVGVATFSLAKQAIVVGDIKQIEPVWNITSKIDIGNLREIGLIDDYGDLEYERKFDPKGFLASTGSIMKMAQNACHYKEDGLNEKGVLLVEHRRCYDEIINYCNVLAYNGQLKPLKGKAKDDLLFPPMYCIHVEGKSKTAGSSRYNLDEVEAIVNWIKNNRPEIEAKYGKLEEKVGIITPFVGQKDKLKSALKKIGVDTDILKLGTVHALQGAERPIVLFSMVYGVGDSGTMFFDRDNKPNMLNVAVSRAQDNFIVFANSGIFNKNGGTPSGLLAKHLTHEGR